MRINLRDADPNTGYCHTDLRIKACIHKHMPGRHHIKVTCINFLGSKNNFMPFRSISIIFLIM